MSKWAGLDKPITAAIAENEPLNQRLFGPDFDRRQARLRPQSSGINRSASMDLASALQALSVRRGREDGARGARGYIGIKPHYDPT